MLYRYLYKILVPINLTVNTHFKTKRTFNAIYIDFPSIREELGINTSSLIESILNTHIKEQLFMFDIPIVLSLTGSIKLLHCSKYVYKGNQGVEMQLSINKDKPRLFLIGKNNILVRPYSIMKVEDSSIWRNDSNTDVIHIPGRMRSNPLLSLLSIYSFLIPTYIYPGFVFSSCTDRGGKYKITQGINVLYYDRSLTTDKDLMRISSSFISDIELPTMYHKGKMPIVTNVYHLESTIEQYTLDYYPSNHIKDSRKMIIKGMYILIQDNKMWVTKIKHSFRIPKAYYDIIVICRYTSL